MNWKNWTLGSTAAAALAGLAIVTAAPSFAQDQSQNAPAAQTYQNNAHSGQSSAGSMQNQNGMSGPSGQMNGTNQNSSSDMTAKSANTVTLSSVRNAKTTLASAQVQDSSGQQVGQVTTVHTSRSGHPTKVDVTLTSNNGGTAKTISVKASQLRYDKNNNTLVTNLTATDLQSLPAASSTSGM
jgi:hypothetical protein